MRLKDNLVFVAQTSEGLSVYEFSFTGDDKRYCGVIAQEVQRINADAVTEDDEGYFLVDYSKLSL